MEPVTDFIWPLLLRICVLLVVSNQYVLAQLNLPIFDFIYQHTNNFNDSIRDTNIFYKEYDFIVIGSGSGGSVVANRLTEIDGFTVLLLEAGGEENFISDVPLTPSATQLTSNRNSTPIMEVSLPCTTNSSESNKNLLIHGIRDATQMGEFNWGYKTDPSPGACLGLSGGVCNWPKGRALGGTSVINFMLYQRGHRRDFDGWAANGNVGWTYDEVLPYFKKSERVGIPELKHSSYHGRDGYLDVQRTSFRTKVLKTFLQSAGEFGYSVNDPNGESLLGFSQAQATLRRGRRCSAAKAFLRPVQNRPNLFISMHSRVTRILIDPKTKTAYGVEFVKRKKRFQVFVRREVILSAGPIASPQLLMLSGVGPREHLAEFGIPVIQDLRVGYNLQDHNVVNGLDFQVNQPITISESSVQRPKYMFDYFFNGQGPFTIPGGAEGYAFVKTSNSSYPPDYPDIEIVVGAGGLSGDLSGAMRNMLGITNEFYQSVYRDLIGKPAFGLVPVLLRPNSRGRISLKSRNPFHWPRLEPNFFQNQTDIETLTKGIRACLGVANTRSFAKWKTRFNKQPFLGCENYVFGSDAYWECSIRRHAGSLQHQVGTCKMGPSSDQDAVVNPRLQVYGVTNLRVVDSSIMPQIVAGHTNAATFMIGEKAADMIKEDWLNSVFCTNC